MFTIKYQHEPSMNKGLRTFSKALWSQQSNFDILDFKQALKEVSLATSLWKFARKSLQTA